MPPAIVKAQVVIKATLCLLVIVMYLILEAIKYYYYCFSDKCLILNPDDKATQNFIYGLKMQFHCEVIQSFDISKADMNKN